MEVIKKEMNCEYCNKLFVIKRSQKQCSNACRLAIKRKEVAKVLDLENEIWKPVFEYEDYYEVSNFGRIKRKEKQIYSKSRNCYIKKKERICEQPIHNYKYVNLIVYGKKTKLATVHRLIAIAFIPNPENKPEVNHIDGNKLNNSLCNLEWVTRSENTLHAYKNNLIPQGENHYNSKLTKSQVIDIFKRTHKGEKCHDIAKEFNLNKETVTNIKFQKMWKSVTKKINN